MGEVLAGKRLGKKALVLGALAQSIPDLDFFASYFLPTTADLLAHRGFTHSLLFALLCGCCLAVASRRLFRLPGGDSGMTFRQFWMFWTVEIGAHIFLDCFNVYGTGVFEPFSHYRVAWDVLYVADPLFTVWIVVAAVVLALSGSEWGSRRRVAMWAIALSGTYLATACLLKMQVRQAFAAGLQKSGVHYRRRFEIPTMLNSLLWYGVAETDSGFVTGYRSVFDTGDIPFKVVPKNEALLQPFAGTPDLRRLVRFSNGYYRGNLHGDSVVLENLRFGEMMPLCRDSPKFAFYYFLSYPDANAMIIQRGRIAGWNKATLADFGKRIIGRRLGNR
jgi:inner membrane protein